MNEKQSLEVIMQMINKAKSNIEDNSFYFLLWGWLVFIASLCHYFLLMVNYDKPFLPWMLMPAGGILSAIYGARQSKQQRSTSYVDDFMKYVLIAFLVSLCLVLVFMSRLGLGTYPMVMLVYGIWLFINGGAIRFNPLLIGGVINWIIAIAAFFVGFDMQLLLLAAAVLLGYIIPGYMLKNKFKKSKEELPQA